MGLLQLPTFMLQCGEEVGDENDTVGNHVIFYTYIRTERVRTFVIISFIPNDIHTVRHKYPIAFVAIRYLIDVSIRAVFFHINSSKDRLSLLEVV